MSNVRLELKWEGVDELQTYLKKTMPQAFDYAIKESLLHAAQDGKEKAKSLVPVDTGALRQSIRIERFAKPAKNITYTGIRAGGYVRNPKTNQLVNYASYVEYGTSRQRPQPYLRPALRYAARRIQDYFWKQLSKKVELG